MKKISLYGDSINLTYFSEQALTSNITTDVSALLQFIENTLPCYISTEVINYILENYGQVDFSTTEDNDIFLDE